MPFKQAGNPDVEIIGAMLSQSPYNENDYAVAIHVRDVNDPEQSDYWYGVLNDEVGNKPDPSKTRWELTLSDLEKLGWKHGGAITNENLKSLIGVKTVAWVKEREYNGKMYYDVKMLNSNSYGPKAVNEADALAKIRALMGNKAPAATATAAPAPTEDEESPFGL